MSEGPTVKALYQALSVEAIDFAPGLQDSTNLFPLGYNVAAHAQPAVADITWTGTIPKCTSKYFVQDILGARLALNDTAFNAGAATLSCRVYVDDPTGTIAARLLFDSTHVVADTGVEDRYVEDVTLAAHPTIFNLLNDGLAHIYYFFLWCDAGNVDVVTVRLWLSNCGTGDADKTSFHILYTGLVDGFFDLFGDSFDSVETGGGGWLCNTLGNAPILTGLGARIVSFPIVRTYGDSATDLTYLVSMNALLMGGKY
jgi:hypothetical protein